MTTAPRRVYQVDAFTTTRFQGNPAGVVPDADGLTARDMQTIARELNNSETAFVLPPDGPDHDVRVRFFTPTVEVPSCGHATIAAHYVRAREAGASTAVRCVQKIGAGLLPVDVVPDGDDYRVVMTQRSPIFEEPLSPERTGAVTTALSLRSADLDPRCPVQVVSTGHSKILVGIRSRERLDGLTPDSARLVALSREIGSNGYYVFTLHDPDDDVLAHGRMFAPAIGIAEDPVTGNANGPLGAYLVAHGLVSARHGTVEFKARQGEAMGRPGTIDVAVDVEDDHPTRVRVGGRAVIVFHTTL